MTRYIWPTLAVFGAFALTFTATAFAMTGTTAGDGSLLDMLRPIYDAFRGHDYDAMGCLALVLLVALARRYGSSRLPFLASEAGAALLLLLGSFGATAGAMAAGPEVMLSMAMVWVALKIAFLAAGGYAALKALIVVPLLRPLQARLPTWAQPILGVILWIFERPNPITKAEGAGDAAVAANPPAGSGTPTKWPPEN